MQKKIQKQQSKLKSQQSSFTVSNSIEQIPLQKDKVVKKNGYKVVSRGDDNLLPYKINDIIKGSVTLASVISSKAEYVKYGELNCSETLKNKLENDLNKYYNWYELSERVSLDILSYGYAFIERVQKGKENFIYHLPNQQVCIAEYETIPENVVIKKDWREIKGDTTEVALYPEFTNVDGEKRQVIMIADYDIDNSTYALPKWIGAYYDAQVESLIGQYNANQFENGITLSSMLLFDFGDIPVLEDGEDEKSYFNKQKQKLENQIKGTSEGRSGKSLIVPVNSGVEKPEYIVYPMEKEGSFQKLQETIENNIVRANNWFRSLSGLATSGTLGNTQQLKNEWSLAERMIRNLQDKIMNAVLLALDNKEEVTFNNQTPLDLVGDISVMKDILLNKSAIGINATIELLKVMGLDEEQAKKIANDSE